MLLLLRFLRLKLMVSKLLSCSLQCAAGSNLGNDLLLYFLDMLCHCQNLFCLLEGNHEGTGIVAQNDVARPNLHACNGNRNIHRINGYTLLS